MNIYKISRPDELEADYNVYDSAVVIADDENEASFIHPDGGINNDCGRSYDSWIKPEDNIVEWIGVANRNSKKGVVVASYIAD